MMEYKGYLGEVVYDDSTGMLHGRVINSGAYPVANCVARDVDSLQREFRISIDEYLASCAEDGVEPVRPWSGRFSLRMGSQLHQQVARAAARDGLSLNRWITLALEKQLAR